MFVKDRMSSPAVTTGPQTPFQEALKIMREHSFHRLPVVKDGVLVGIVAERDLLHAAPSSATSLSIWEIHYLLSRIIVGDLMTKEVITTTPGAPIEDAARLMVTHGVGALPVLGERGEVVGIISETDIFRMFVEMFDGGRSGLRLTLSVPEQKGVLARLARAIFELGGSIESLGTFYGETEGQRTFVIKVRDVRSGELVDTIKALGDQVIDVRELDK